MRISLQRSVLQRSVLLLTAFLYFALLLIFGFRAQAQTSGNSGTIQGTVTDPTGAVVPKAKLSPQSRERVCADGDHGRHGKIHYSQRFFQTLIVTITSAGFAPQSQDQDIDVRSVVPVNLGLVLAISGATETVTVEAGAGLST